MRKIKYSVIEYEHIIDVATYATDEDIDETIRDAICDNVEFTWEEVE